MATNSKQYNRKWFADHPDYQRSRYAMNPERQKAAIEKWRAKNRIKENAKQKIQRAVRNGKIIRPDHCSLCGLVCKPHGHHPDYSKPLEVIWLCRFCHKKEHAIC